MNSPAHFVIGAAICRYTPSKPLGFVLALASHFALDALPHLEHYRYLPEPPQEWVRVYFAPVTLTVQLLVVPLIALTLLQLRRRGQPWRTVLYVVVGGGIACLPDLLTELLGLHSLIGHLNEHSHDLWHRGLTLAENAGPHRRPAIMVVLVLTELSVFVGGLWLLFRGDTRRED